MNQGIITSPEGFFYDLIAEAIKDRKLKTLPLSQSYLANLMQEFLLTEKLYDEADATGRKRRETLAELYMRATQLPPAGRRELLKKLGDVSLYVSGFFGESLKRKVVDVDYYVEMGGAAYGQLATDIESDLYSEVFKDFSKRFLDYVDVLSVISRKALQQNQDLLRTYDLYVSTGSRLAQEDLAQQGLLNQDLSKVKGHKQ